MKNTLAIGNTGENLACAYLVKNRYRILLRNHRERWDEIDIVAMAIDSRLIFVEVKTLIGSYDDRPGISPEDNLTDSKLKKLRRACQLFVGKHPGLLSKDRGWQIDLLAIVLPEVGDPKESAIRHYENI